MVDKAADNQETGISTPEDFWTPLAPPPKTAAYKEQYQPIKPPPEHDGTECLKWDDSLWSHADHIKVSSGSGGAGAVCLGTAGGVQLHQSPLGGARPALLFQKVLCGLDWTTTSWAG